MMGLSLLHISFPCGKELSDLKFIFHISVILKTSLVGILRQHSEISIYKTKKSKQIKNPDTKYGKYKKYKCQDH